MTQPASPVPTIEVTAADLPLHCPTAQMPAWSRHPRVFLKLAAQPGSSGLQARCPYCGTRYSFNGELPHGH